MLGRANGWIDDDPDPELAKDAHDETRANSDRGLAKPDGEFDRNRPGC